MPHFLLLIRWIVPLTGASLADVFVSYSRLIYLKING